jgi:uncharacterized membrane protein
MKPINVSTTIDAPLEHVFRTISDVRNFRNAVPHIKHVEFLSSQQVGMGTRFRETRLMNGRENTVELEVTEYVTDDRIRLVSDAGGTIWDTLFTVSGNQEAVTLVLQMDIIPHTLLAKLMTPLIRGAVAKAVASDVNAIKTYCESSCDLPGHPSETEEP